MKRKKIKSVWREYLTLSMRERRGLSILLSILLFQLIFLFYLNTSELKIPFPDFETVRKLQADISNESLSEELKIPRKVLSNDIHTFDPNTLSRDKWISFGLTEKQSGSVLNYVKKGGKFRIKKDVMKIYGMNESLYKTLLPYIDLPDSIVYERFERNDFKKRAKELIEINRADSVELEKLKGIGPTLASRIVRYRERLGGYTSTEQLKEVYGINDTLYDLIRSQIVLKDPQIRVLSLNTDSFSLLASHPYIGKKLAGMILNYRKQHQRFVVADDLKNLPLLTDEIFRKLAPYLKVD